MVYMSGSRGYSNYLYDVLTPSYGCSSKNGQLQAVCFRNGGIYITKDLGTTWTPVQNARNWQSICSNADGTILYATVYNGRIYKSIDSGLTWNEYTTDGANHNWWGICCDSTGNYFIACVSSEASNTNKIWLKNSSSNGFTNLAGITTTQGFRACCCSSDFTKLYVCCTTGEFYISSNGGVSWTQKYSASAVNSRTSVCCSSDGTIVYTCSYNSTGSGVLYSSDSGGTFTEIYSVSKNCQWVNCNNSGNTVIMCAYNDNIYIRTNTANDSWSIVSENANKYQTVSIVDGEAYGKGVTFLFTLDGTAGFSQNALSYKSYPLDLIFEIGSSYLMTNYYN